MSDYRCRIYPRHSISTDKLQLAPDTASSLQLRVSGAPRWWGTKYLKVEIAPGVISREAITLTKHSDEVEKRAVSALPDA